MLHFLAVFVAVCGVILAAPLKTCERQAECLDITVTELEDGQYELCLFFNNSLAECQKEDDAISHACKAGDDNLAEFKVEDWGTGDDNALCEVVGCGEIVNFGVKDGPTCDSEDHWFVDFGTQNYSEYVHCYDTPMDCSGNPRKINSGKACRWAVLAPSCNATTTAAPETTTPPETTTTTTTTTTTEEPTTTTTTTTTEEPTTTTTTTTTTAAPETTTAEPTTTTTTTTTETPETTLPERCAFWTDVYCAGELPPDASDEDKRIMCERSEPECCFWNDVDTACLSRTPSAGDPVYARVTQGSSNTQLVSVTSSGGDGNGNDGDGNDGDGNDGDGNDGDGSGVDGDENSELGGASQRVAIYGGLVALVMARFM